MDKIPPAEQYNLCSHDFDDIDMSEYETCLMSMRMFLHHDLLHKFHIPHKVTFVYICYFDFLSTTLHNLHNLHN